MALEDDIATESNYGSAFSIDTSERYIALERSMLGEPDYALVVKSIESGEDEFVLTLDDVMKDHPNAAGNFSVGKWIERPDGEYLITEIFDGARETAYIRVRAGTWETQIYDTPRDLKPGVERATPPFAPLYAYTNIVTWAGFAEVTDAIMEEQIARGETKRLMIADLSAGKSVLVDEFPLTREHRFDLKWLTDSELEYTDGDGTRKTYRIE